MSALSRFCGAVAVVAALVVTGCTVEVDGEGALAADVEPGPEPSGSPGPGPTDGPSDSPSECPGAAGQPETGSPEEALITGPLDPGLAKDAEGSGSRSLDDLLASDYEGVSDARETLSGAGFLAAAQVTWTAGQPQTPQRRVEVAEILQFSTAEGACTFAEWEAARGGLRPLSNVAVPGAVGGPVEIPGNLNALQYLATKGRYALMVWGVHASSDRVTQAARHDLTSLWARA